MLEQANPQRMVATPDLCKSNLHTINGFDKQIGQKGMELQMQDDSVNADATFCATITQNMLMLCHSKQWIRH